jgi:hypothetical protein
VNGIDFGYSRIWGRAPGIFWAEGLLEQLREGLGLVESKQKLVESG